MDIEEYIALNIEEDLSLEKIAEEFNYAPYYLSRKYKEEKGMSLPSFIKKSKMTPSDYRAQNPS